MSRMRIRLVTTSVGIWSAAAFTVIPRQAAACSCDLTTLLSPHAGATDVPLNAVVVYRSLTASIVVHDLTRDVDVPTTIDPFGDVSETWLVRPNQPLAPNTTFEVRPSPAPGAPGPRFMTGTTTDETSPVYDGFASFQAETTDLSSAPCRDSCWSGNSFNRLRLGYAPPPDDTAVLLMEFYRPSELSAVATVPLFRRYSVSDWPLQIVNAGCAPVTPPFAPEEDLCIRLVAFDMAGHRSGDPRQICTRSVACSPRFNSACMLLDQCAPRSEPSPEGGAGPSEEAGTPPTSDSEPSSEGGVGSAEEAGTPAARDSGVEVGAPTVPIGETQEGGCSLTGGRAARGSAPLFAMAVAGALLWGRRRRAPTTDAPGSCWRPAGAAAAHRWACRCTDWRRGSRIRASAR
jgi:hypothetical protein